MFHESKLPHDVCNFRRGSESGFMSTRGAASGAPHVCGEHERVDGSTFTFRSSRMSDQREVATRPADAE